MIKKSILQPPNVIPLEQLEIGKIFTGPEQEIVLEGGAARKKILEGGFDGPDRGHRRNFGNSISFFKEVDQTFDFFHFLFYFFLLFYPPLPEFFKFFGLGGGLIFYINFMGSKELLG